MCQVNGLCIDLGERASERVSERINAYEWASEDRLVHFEDRFKKTRADNAHCTTSTTTTTTTSKKLSKISLHGILILSFVLLLAIVVFIRCLRCCCCYCLFSSLSLHFNSFIVSFWSSVRSYVWSHAHTCLCLCIHSVRNSALDSRIFTITPTLLLWAVKRTLRAHTMFHENSKTQRTAQPNSLHPIRMMCDR